MMVMQLLIRLKSAIILSSAHTLILTTDRSLDAVRYVHSKDSNGWEIETTSGHHHPHIESQVNSALSLLVVVCL